MKEVRGIVTSQGILVLVNENTVLVCCIDESSAYGGLHETFVKEFPKDGLESLAEEIIDTSDPTHLENIEAFIEVKEALKLIGAFPSDPEPQKA